MPIIEEMFSWWYDPSYIIRNLLYGASWWLEFDIWLKFREKEVLMVKKNKNIIIVVIEYALTGGVFYQNLRLLI